MDPENFKASDETPFSLTLESADALNRWLIRVIDTCRERNVNVLSISCAEGDIPQDDPEDFPAVPDVPADIGGESTVSILTNTDALNRFQSSDGTGGLSADLNVTGKDKIDDTMKAFRSIVKSSRQQQGATKALIETAADNRPNFLNGLTALFDWARTNKTRIGDKEFSVSFTFGSTQFTSEVFTIKTTTGQGNNISFANWKQIWENLKAVLKDRGTKARLNQMSVIQSTAY